ncbi:MAG: heavy metal translocating P-type ATPase [Helicobacteraceae bacterium]|jgi:Cu+-exporting ATPase|nr:heavy metal translocating P-type ATPase [Helicobacteraceae bacterium]
MRCDHCGLDIPENALIKEDNHNFCCKGCAGVFRLLNDMKLEKFYELKGEQKLNRAQEINKSAAMFDSDAFAKRFIARKENNLCEMSLALEGVHCAACVWLIERVVNKLDGAIETDINFTTNKAKILFDENVLKPSEIVSAIRSIGYDAAAYDPKIAETNAKAERKEYYTRLIVALFAMMNTMWLAVARYLGLFSGMDENLANIIYLAEFLLATPTLFFSGWVFYRGGYFGLKNGFVTMDLLVATGATLTYAYSIYATLISKAEPYFDSVTMIISFVLIGKFLEVKAKKSAVDTLDKLIALAPNEIIRIEGGNRIKLSPEEIKSGDIIEIEAGERIVFDGVILSGSASLDMSSISGESKPRFSGPNDSVISGAINTDGILRIKVENDYAHSTFFRVINLLEESLKNRPNIENFANKISRKFSTTILSIAAITFLVWNFALDATFDRSLMIAISVIVIACPCALALATPIASVIAALEGAKRSALFRATKHIETLAKAKFILLDKTGTLTIGKPQVISCETTANFNPSKLYALIVANSHPISKGVSEFLPQKHNILKCELKDIKIITGRGAIALDQNNKIVLGGNAALMKENNINAGKQDDENSIFYFAENGEITAKFSLADTIKTNAEKAVKFFKNFGLKPIIISGDSYEITKKVASDLQIPDFYAELLPDQKAEIVRKTRENGAVIMTGDGLNDTVALAQAEIAVAMHSGAETAVAVSDIVLLRDDLADLALAIAIARKTYRVILQNIAISIGYNALLIPLAAAGFITPLIAALSMSFSSLLVVGNSMRVKSAAKEFDKMLATI